MNQPKQIGNKNNVNLEDSAETEIGHKCDEWVAVSRRRSNAKSLSAGSLCSVQAETLLSSSPPTCRMQMADLDKPNSGAAVSQSSNQLDDMPEINFWDRLGNAATLDVEANDFPWDTLISLHHIKHTASNEYSEDEINKVMEVTVNSGGVLFYALFHANSDNEVPTKEAVAVIKIASSRMATQSERLGNEFAKLLGVKTPQARVIHNSSSEWQMIKDASEKAREMAVANGDELGEVTCSDFLEALELSRCLFLMNYVHGSPLVENSNAYDSREAAESTAATLGRVLLLDLILRNEDRLPCPLLGWRGNPANLLFSNKLASANTDALDKAYHSVCRRYKSRIVKSIERERKKERRAISVNGRLGSQDPELTTGGPDHGSNLTDRFSDNEGKECAKSPDFHIVAIDSGVPRRPPAGKRAKDQENYPKGAELIINDIHFCSNLLYDVSSGKLGFPGPGQSDASSDFCSYLSESDMIPVVHAFRAGFRGALRDLQSFHIFLLTLYQKLDGLSRMFLSVLNKIFSESDKDDSVGSDSPSHPAWCNSNTQFQDNWRSSEGHRRLTMKLREFNKLAKVDAELGKELEQWNEMVREDVVRLCQLKNFNTGFFEGNDNNIAIDAYELKVRLEHILERISLISDAASTECPSPITDYLYIGGALAAKSMFTLRHLGITHILCLCADEIGQSDSQNPELFEYHNFSVSDSDDEDISSLFREASDFIDHVEKSGGRILVHCFEGKSRSATVVLAYLMLRKGLTLLEAWNKLKKVHRRAQPNDGFAKILQNLDEQLHGKISMEWQQRKPMMKVCPICGNDVGLSSSSLKLHLQKSHRMLSSGSVDSAMTLEIQKAMEALENNLCGSTSPT